MIIYDIDDFSNEISKYDRVLVDFYREDCIPCKMISSYLEELDKNDNFLCIKIDIEKNMDVYKKYNITTVPAFVLFKNGKAVKKIMGFIPKNKIWSFYNE